MSRNDKGQEFALHHQIGLSFFNTLVGATVADDAKIATSISQGVGYRALTELAGKAQQPSPKMGDT